MQKRELGNSKLEVPLSVLAACRSPPCRVSILSGLAMSNSMVFSQPARSLESASFPGDLSAPASSRERSMPTPKNIAVCKPGTPAQVALAWLPENALESAAIPSA